MIETLSATKPMDALEAEKQIRKQLEAKREVMLRTVERTCALLAGDKHRALLNVMVELKELLLKPLENDISVESIAAAESGETVAVDNKSMWAAAVDKFEAKILGLARKFDDNYFKIIRIIVSRGKTGWDQPLSVAQKIRLEVKSDAGAYLQKEELQTGGFVFIPYTIRGNQVLVWVKPELSLTGPGLSLPSASVGNMKQFEAQGSAEGMFGGRLQELVTLASKGMTTQVTEYLLQHPIVGPLSTDDPNRGTQDAVYVPAELSNEYAQRWMETQGGTFVPLESLKKIAITDLLLAHTKNAVAIMEAKEMDSTATAIASWQVVRYLIHEGQQVDRYAK